MGIQFPSGIANVEQILDFLLSRGRHEWLGSYCSIRTLTKARQTDWLTQQLGHSLETMEIQVQDSNIGFWQISPFQHERLLSQSLQPSLTGSAFWSLKQHSLIFMSLQPEETQPVQRVYLLYKTNKPKTKQTPPHTPTHKCIEPGF